MSKNIKKLKSLANQRTLSKVSTCMVARFGT